MQNQLDRFWWRPLARRIFRWGLWGAFLFQALPLTSLAIYIYFTDRSLPRLSSGYIGNPTWDSLIQSLLMAAFCVSPVGAMGAMLGWVSGFYAPITEPKNPLKSRFFNMVTTHSLLLWIASCVTFGVGITFFHFAVWRNIKTPYYELNYFVLAGIIAALVAFGFCLWRATNRALHLTKKETL